MHTLVYKHKESGQDSVWGCQSLLDIYKSSIFWKEKILLIKTVRRQGKVSHRQGKSASRSKAEIYNFFNVKNSDWRLALPTTHPLFEK